MSSEYVRRPLPKQLEHLAELAFDLRLIGSKTMSNVWRRLDAEAWVRCNNPYMVLQHAHQEHLEQAAADEAMIQQMAWFSWREDVRDRVVFLEDFEVQVMLGDLGPNCVQVQLEADPAEGSPLMCVPMQREGAIHGVVNGHIYRAAVTAQRPAEHFTPRIVPAHPAACIPMESARTVWHG